jgi:GNAT superfamily N-acetyltransferase
MAETAMLRCEPMLRTHLDYEIDDSLVRMNFHRVYAWMISTYWWEHGLTREKAERGARRSTLVIGACHDGEQVAYCRAVSDTIRFAWLADVYVAEPHRNKVIARAMVRFAIDHPDLAEVARWILATRDAHGVYADLGFGPLTNPGHMMELRREPAR